MFQEQPSKHLMNRRLARVSTTKPATLSDGRKGVVIHWGDRLLVMSTEEAQKLTQDVTDALQE